MRVRTIVGAVLLAVIGSISAAIVVVALSSLTAWPLIWLGAAAVVAPFAVMVVRGHIDPFEPVCLFASGYALLFVVRPTFDLLSPNGTPMVSGLSPIPDFQLALLISLVGLLSFYLGYYVRFGPWLGRAIPLPQARLTPGVIKWGLLLTSAAGLAAYSLFLMSAGGLAALRTVLAGRSVAQGTIEYTSSGYLYTGPLWITGPAILLLATTSRWLSGRGIIGLGLLAISELVNAAQGNRSWLLVVAAMVAVLWYLRRHSRPSSITIVAGVVVVFLVGVVPLGQYRNVQGRSGTFVGAVGTAVTNPDNTVVEFFQGGDTGMFDDFAIELQFVPAIVPHALGQTYLGDLSDPVPRSLWAAKPPAGDNQLMAHVWPRLAAERVGLSFSMFGEPYWNFGIAGVLLLCMVMGVAWRGLYEWFKRAPDSPPVIAVFAISWPFLFLYLWGGVGVSYSRQVIALAPAVLIMVVADVSERRRLGHLPPATGPEPA